MSSPAASQPCRGQCPDSVIGGDIIATPGIPACARLRATQGKCGQCEFKNICGGSRSRAFALTGDIWRSDPFASTNRAHGRTVMRRQNLGDRLRVMLQACISKAGGEPVMEQFSAQGFWPQRGKTDANPQRRAPDHRARARRRATADLGAGAAKPGALAKKPSTSSATLPIAATTARKSRCCFRRWRRTEFPPRAARSA